MDGWGRSWGSPGGGPAKCGLAAGSPPGWLAHAARPRLYGRPASALYPICAFIPLRHCCNQLAPERPDTPLTEHARAYHLPRPPRSPAPPPLCNRSGTHLQGRSCKANPATQAPAARTSPSTPTRSSRAPASPAPSPPRPPPSLPAAPPGLSGGAPLASRGIPAKQSELVLLACGPTEVACGLSPTDRSPCSFPPCLSERRPRSQPTRHEPAPVRDDRALRHGVGAQRARSRAAAAVHAAASR